MTDIEIATAALQGHTLALCKNGEVITSDLRGVAPMVGFISSGKKLDGYSAADKVVGKAAAMLFIKAGVTTVHAVTLSQGGQRLFEKHGIKYSFESLTEHIINRSRTGLCPMEQAVSETDDIDTGVKLIMKKLEEMMLDTRC